MLRTTNDHEVAIFSSIHGRGVKIWRAVSMELRIPYFFVSHAIKEDGAWLHETCLLWREADLVEFCKEISLDVNRKIVQLSMLLPATEAGRWNLEELKEIWSESDQYNGCSPIFIANDGRHISQGNRKVPANVTNAKDKIYSIQSANRNRQEKLGDIFRGIREGEFKTNPSDTSCPNCPAFFVCGGVPPGTLSKNF